MSSNEINRYNNAFSFWFHTQFLLFIVPIVIEMPWIFNHTPPNIFLLLLWFVGFLVEFAGGIIYFEGWKEKLEKKNVFFDSSPFW